jgi:beta-glucuronidase
MRIVPFFALLGMLAVAAPAVAQTPAPPYRPDVPQNRTLYENGQTGRFLVGGTWLFRADPKDEGVGLEFFRRSSTAGWSQVSVPHDWTAGDNSVASMNGSVGWYRKDFRVPSKGANLSWILRFESVNYRATVYLNGKRIGEHVGAHLAFEVPADGISRTGVNRLVIRVDSRRGPQDLPPGGSGSDGLPRGGWWNGSGLLREVYLRQVDQVDVESVHVTPTVPVIGGPASVKVEVGLRGYAASRQALRLRGKYGSVPVNLGTTTLGPSGHRVLTKTIQVPNPSLWSPQSPTLYKFTLAVDGRSTVPVVTGTGKKRKRALAPFKPIGGYRENSGIRKIEVNAQGLTTLNGKILNLRGFGLHEDNIVTGQAVTNAQRDNYIRWTKELSGSIIRGHYPLSPYLLEQADKNGVMIYSEIPVWSVESIYLQRDSVRAAALDQLRENIDINRDHPSVLVWSIGNELTSKPGPPENAWIGTAARTAKKLDPTRPVTLALVGYPPDQCRTVYKSLDIISVNTYFGWYPAPVGQSADRTLLGPFLDQMRACYPDKPIFVTEFGAEGNRSGPAEEKGTYEFQDDYVRYTHSVISSKPFVNAATYWTLQEFRVRPNYTGGNPRGEAPFHQKGPLDRFGNQRPIFNVIKELYSATPPLRRAPAK